MTPAGQAGTGWTEKYIGGSEASEAELIENFTHEINELQDANRARDGGPVARAFHAGTMGDVVTAVFEARPDVPADLAVGPFVPGAGHPAIVRFSSATASPRHRVKGDLRGIAIRVSVDGGTHDFLMTNGPVSHARDVRQFMISAMAGTAKSRIVSLLKILFAIGPRETLRMVKALRRDSAHKNSSLALERYWTRAAFAIGPVAVKFVLAPVDAGPGIEPTFDYDQLRTELIERLRRGPVTFELQAQRFVDEQRTPIEDISVEWTEDVSPPEPLARLTIPQQELGQADAEVEALSFNPWNTLGGIRPLGSSNRARQRVYASSAEHRRTPTER